MLYRVTTENGHDRSNGGRCYWERHLPSRKVILYSQRSKNRALMKSASAMTCLWNRPRLSIHERGQNELIGTMQKLCRLGHDIQTFQAVDAIIREYSRVTGKTLDQLPPEPAISDFYTPSDGQKSCNCLYYARDGCDWTSCL